MKTDKSQILANNINKSLLICTHPGSEQGALMNKLNNKVPAKCLKHNKQRKQPITSAKESETQGKWADHGAPRIEQVGAGRDLRPDCLTLILNLCLLQGEYSY